MSNPIYSGRTCRTPFCPKCFQVATEHHEGKETCRDDPQPLSVELTWRCTQCKYEVKLVAKRAA